MARLLQSLGVAKGDRVAVQVEKSPEAVFLYLACLRAGASTCRSTPPTRRPRSTYFLGDAEPQVVVCRPEATRGGRRVAKAAARRCLTLDQAGGGTLMDAAPAPPGLRDRRSASRRPRRDPLHLGHHRAPKGAMLTHNNLLSNAMTLHRSGASAPTTCCCTRCRSSTPTACSWRATRAAQRLAMMFLPQFDADEVIARCCRAPPCSWACRPSTCACSAQPASTREPWPRHAPVHLGLGAAAGRDLQQFRERTGHAILERYGMTETGMLTSNPLVGRAPRRQVGLPLPGVELRIVDAEGAVLARARSASSRCGGPTCSRATGGAGEDRRGFRADGFFITGDVGRVDDDGYVSSSAAPRT